MNADKCRWENCKRRALDFLESQKSDSRLRREEPIERDNTGLQLALLLNFQTPKWLSSALLGVSKFVPSQILLKLGNSRQN